MQVVSVQNWTSELLSRGWYFTAGTAWWYTLVNPGLKQRWHILNPSKIRPNVTKCYSRFLAGLSLWQAQLPNSCKIQVSDAGRADTAFGDLQVYGWDSVPPPDHASFKHAFPKAWGFWNDVWLHCKHVAFVGKHSHTGIAHKANEYSVASTELWKQTSHISLEVVFEHVYLQLTVNGSAFMSRIVCC